jgi:drug/metabolite transporter (DMT)-like permease
MKELKPTVAVFIYLQPVFATVFRSLGKDELNMVKIVSAVLFSGVYGYSPKQRL